MQEEIIDLINEGEFGDAFEKLRVLGLMKNNEALTQLKNSYALGTSKTDVNFVDRLKMVVREIPPKEKAPQEPSTITETHLVTPSPISKQALDIIPTPETYFSGRKTELADLHAIFEAHNFISIVGAGGIGKSQLVSKYLEESQIPEEKICWIQCEPTTSLDSIMTKIGFGELLRVENQTDKNKISNVIYRLNREKRYLFLEDYHDIQQRELIESFLGSSQSKLKDSKIILISRDNTQSFLKPKKFTIQGLKEDDLLKLIDSLRAFFEETIPFDDTELLDLAIELKGHPLAIYLSLDLLESGFSMQEIQKEIINRGHEKTASGKETISERLLNAIFTRKDASPEERQFIKEFSVFRGIVSEQIINTVFEINAWFIATKLKEKNILKVTSKEGIRHYSLHPLVREFCYKQFFSDQTGRGQALELHSKVAQYFIQERSSLISILNEEKIHYHLIRAQEWGQIYTDIEVLGEDMIAQGHFDHLNKMINQLESSYQQTPPIAIAFKGNILYKKGNLDEAATLFLQIESSADLKTRIKGILGSGKILHSRGDIQEADKRFQLALDLLEDEREEFISEYISVLFSIGDSELAKSNYDECFKLYGKAKELAGKNNLQSEFATALNNIGLVHNEKKEYNQAMPFYNKSLQIRKILGEQSNIAISLNNIAEVHGAEGNDNKSMAFHTESLQINKNLGNQFQISISLNNIGAVYRRKNNYDKAKKFYLECLEISKNLGEQSIIATSINNIGLIYSKTKDFKEAMKCYQESLHIRKKLGEQARIATSLNNIGLIKFDQQQFHEALNYLLNSLLIKKSLKIPYKGRLFTLLKIKRKLGIETYKKAIEINLKKYEPKLQILFKGEVRREVLDLPYKKKTTLKPNDKVSVKSSDGSIKKMKYKKAILAIKKGADIEILYD